MKRIIITTLLVSTSLFAQQKVGINTTLPLATLDINGNLRVLETKETTDEAKYFLTIDNNNIVKKVDKIKIINEGGSAVVESRTYAILAKGIDQKLPERGKDQKVIFDGTLEGVNTSNVITLSADKTSLKFPANKAFKITGMIGVRGLATSSSNSAPAYITSKFEIDASSGAKKIISTQGYVESSTEEFDDGGVSNPIIIFTTGATGGSVHLLARYGGSDPAVINAKGYYLAGAPTATSLGTYFIIEEL